MIAAIRIRGLKKVRVDIRDTLTTLNLDRKNHCVIISEKTSEGMLKKARDYIAYGPVKTETVAKLLQKRARIMGDKPVTPEHLKAHKLSSFQDAAAHVMEGKMTLAKMDIKPVFRLNSPRKGFPSVGIKKSAELKGPLGYHPEGMDALLEQMM